MPDRAISEMRESSADMGNGCQNWLRSGTMHLECDGHIVAERPEVGLVRINKYVPRNIARSERLDDCIDFLKPYLLNSGWTMTGVDGYQLSGGLLDWQFDINVPLKDEVYQWEHGCWDPSLDREPTD